jgi:hypothetical protein
VAVDPEPFLSLRLWSRQWLDAALPTLLDAVTPRLLDGDRVVHLDVRSDNCCSARTPPCWWTGTGR